MEKELSEMSMAELWTLFPIFLVEQNAEWHRWYKEEAQELRRLLPEHTIHSVNHIGSTAIKGIKAKNIVDVLVELTEDADMLKMAEALSSQGYIIMSNEGKRISLNKGYTKTGFAEKVFHIHLRYVGDNDEVYFRDFLNEHPEVATEYESLKVRLSETFKHDRDAYTNAKGEFVKKWTAVAKES